MIAVDTNILARFYCEDPDDPEAQRQRPAAQQILQNSPAVFVAKTVLLELEWVMRAFYGFGADGFCQVGEHLLGMDHVTVEDWEAVKDALDLHRNGLDFADALHWASGRACSRFYTFDDRRFSRRAGRMGLQPPVSVPSL